MPTPPPFMRTCPQCAELLGALVEAFAQALTDPHYDGAERIQIALARHLADVHPQALPAPHTDGCPSCARYEELDPDSVFLREHLARGLFLPDELARLP
ncbi:hypothetical protein [Streptomyces chartreusis]|uniref:hypothetical protein n=1 Tax=Streptomyces chartreusis TaxID=1969 RepID=UPI0037F913BC